MMQKLSPLKTSNKMMKLYFHLHFTEKRIQKRKNKNKKLEEGKQINSTLITI